MSTSNYWIDNHTLEGCTKRLKSWLEGMCEGAVFHQSTAINDLITDFYDAHPELFDFMDDVYVEFQENQQDDGGLWYSHIDVREY